MFCPKCGKGEQTPNNYCRSCGEFLPDLENPGRGRFRKKTPDEQMTVSLVLSFLSAIAGFSMAFLLIVTHTGKEDVNVSVHLATVFLFVIGCWQTINLIFGLRLKKHFKNRKRTVIESESKENPNLHTTERDYLPEANTNDFIAPPSVTERTTNILEKVPREKS